MATRRSLSFRNTVQGLKRGGTIWRPETVPITNVLMLEYTFGKILGVFELVILLL